MTPQSITSEVQKLSPSAIIELFEVDATNLGSEVLRFHAGTNALVSDVIWQGQTYFRFPVQATGFEISGQGQLPRPRLKVSNYMSSITAYLLLYEDLIGAKVTRKRTLAKYLDGANFQGGVNPSADATAAFIDDVFYIDRKVSETREAVEFELVSTLDLVGVQLPKRQIIQNLCLWAYRGPECGYTGGGFYDSSDVKINTAETPEAQLVIDRFSDYQTKRTLYLNSERELALAAQALETASQYAFVEEKYDPVDSYVAAALFVNTFSARWEGTPVSLGNEYRKGPFVKFDNLTEFSRIQKWAFNPLTKAAAQAAFDAAKATRDSRLADATTALSDYQSALSALPANDPIYKKDRCGKRLTSCKLRFPDQDLPFGGFPGASLFK